jgi:hypothetical protein
MKVEIPFELTTEMETYLHELKFEIDGIQTISELWRDCAYEGKIDMTPREKLFLAVDKLLFEFSRRCEEEMALLNNVFYIILEFNPTNKHSSKDKQTQKEAAADDSLA